MNRFPVALIEGGPGSGNWGHGGLRGVWGGSSPGRGKQAAKYWDKFTGDGLTTPRMKTKKPKSIPFPPDKELQTRKAELKKHLEKFFTFDDAFFSPDLGPGWFFELSGKPGVPIQDIFPAVRLAVKSLDRTAYRNESIFLRDEHGNVRRLWYGPKVSFDLSTSPTNVELVVLFHWQDRIERTILKRGRKKK